MNKLDLSVLPDGFLIENKILGWHLSKVGITAKDYYIYRPALNHWHFNDGSMVLPDGLVVEIKDENLNAKTGRTLSNNHGSYVETGNGNTLNYYFTFGGYNNFLVYAVKILGVTPEYAEHGKELGMEVIAL